jgi:outer membrane protein
MRHLQKRLLCPYVSLYLICLITLLTGEQNKAFGDLSTPHDLNTPTAYGQTSSPDNEAVAQLPRPEFWTLDDGRPITLKAVLTKSDNLPIDLPTVVKLVEDQNLNLKIQTQQVRIEKSRYRQRMADFLPNFGLDYNQNRFQGGIQIFGGQTLTIYRTTYQPQLVGQWTFHPGGKQIYDLFAQKRRKQAEEIQLKETFQSQLKQAVEEYYALLQSQINFNNANASVLEAEKQAEFNEARANAGVSTKLDALRSQALLSEQQAAMIDAGNELGKAQQKLLNRLNLDHTVNLMAPEYEEDPLSAKITLFEKLDESHVMVETGIKNHPSIQRLDQDLKALGMDLRTIRSDLIPSFTATSFINGVGPGFDNLALSRFAGFALNWNILESMGLKIPLRMQEKKAEISQKLFERQLAARSVEQGVIEALLDVRSTEKRIDSTHAQWKYAKQAFQLAEGRFKAGLGIQLDVLSAQIALFSARKNLSQSVMDHNRAQVRLLESMGTLTPERLLVPPGQGAPNTSNRPVSKAPFSKAPLSSMPDSATQQGAASR